MSLGQEDNTKMVLDQAVCGEYYTRLARLTRADTPASQRELCW
jgi:hypothetical protein